MVAKYRENGNEKLRPRYVFSNRSSEIKQIFCDACERIGVSWTRPNDREIAVARAASVAELDTFIGPKR